MKKLTRRILLGLGGAMLSTGLVAGTARAAGPVIALSNAYYGNTWRHQMVEAFQAAAAQAKKQGLISDYIILNGDGSVNQQMSQMSDLILKHVNAIVDRRRVQDGAERHHREGLRRRHQGAGLRFHRQRALRLQVGLRLRRTIRRS